MSDLDLEILKNCMFKNGFNETFNKLSKLIIEEENKQKIMEIEKQKVLPSKNIIEDTIEN